MIDEAKIDAEDDKVVEVKRASTRRRLLQIQLDQSAYYRVFHDKHKIPGHKLLVRKYSHCKIFYSHTILNIKWGRMKMQKST